jgi:hypothetical protein
MDTETKCLILEELSKAFTFGELDREFFSEFIIYNDLGLPLAQMVAYDLGTLNNDGKKIIDETWLSLCNLLNLDPTEEFQNIDDMLDEYESDD